MSNTLTILLDNIQIKTGQTLDQVAKSIGYSRVYLTAAKKNDGENENIIAALRSKYPEKVQNNTYQKVSDSNLDILIKANADLSASNKVLAEANLTLSKILSSSLTNENLQAAASTKADLLELIARLRTMDGKHHSTQEASAILYNMISEIEKEA
jgi:hypothetical protein